MVFVQRQIRHRGQSIANKSWQGHHGAFDETHRRELVIGQAWAACMTSVVKQGVGFCLKPSAVLNNLMAFAQFAHPSLLISAMTGALLDPS